MNNIYGCGVMGRFEHSQHRVTICGGEDVVGQVFESFLCVRCCNVRFCNIYSSYTTTSFLVITKPCSRFQISLSTNGLGGRKNP